MFVVYLSHFFSFPFSYSLRAVFFALSCSTTWFRRSSVHVLQIAIFDNITDDHSCSLAIFYANKFCTHSSALFDVVLLENS